jgi:putative endonuclease
VDRKALGALGEKRAVEFLKKRKYRILETNFRCRGGEIDIVAQEKDYLVFVEVRTRASDTFGTPEESVTPAKKERLISAALTYLQTHVNLPSLWRFDVVAIETSQEGQLSRIELIQNAISG